MKILCLHGLGGGANSNTGRKLAEYFSRQGVTVIAPEIPIMPEEAFEFLTKLQRQEQPDIIVGTSLGGFYARYLHGAKKVLINPAMRSEDVKNAIPFGVYSFFKPRQNGEQTYVIDEKFISQLQDISSVQEPLIDQEMRDETYALFGTNDDLLSNYSLFKGIYGESHAKYINAEHRLTDENISNDLIPMIEELLKSKK